MKQDIKSLKPVNAIFTSYYNMKIQLCSRTLVLQICIVLALSPADMSLSMYLHSVSSAGSCWPL